MRRKLNFKKFLFLICLLFMAIAILIILFTKFKATSNTHSTQDSELNTNIQTNKSLQAVEKISELINSQGGENAYKIFKQEYANNQYSIQHASAHIFGEILYEKEGSSAINICDEAFGYGCYHSFIAKVIQTEGLESIYKLDIVCKDLTGDKTGKCQHGLGHGIQAYFGYQSDSLKQALQWCDKLNNDDRIGGCFGGVYMEYNFRTMLADGAKIRQYSENLLSPCNQIESGYRPGCYFHQTQWWLNILPGDNEKKMDRINELCNSLSDEERPQCYSGSGNFLVNFLNGDDQKTVQLCERFSYDYAKNICKGRAANIFSNLLGSKEKAASVCFNANTDVNKQCLQNAGVKE